MVVLPMRPMVRTLQLIYDEWCLEFAPMPRGLDGIWLVGFSGLNGQKLLMAKIG
jgi:hypothetical protein